jgi:His-Xaa-Ser system protein HxsD
MNKTSLTWAIKESLPWTKQGGTYSILLDSALYSTEAIFKTCYLFLDDCYLFVETTGPVGPIKVYFSPLDESKDLIGIIGEFSNRLIWQEVRQKVADETQLLREIIAAQAFTETGVLDRTLQEADYNIDPLGIAG